MGDHAPGRRGLSAAARGGVYPARPLDPVAAEAGRLLFAGECRFIAGAAGSSAMPPETLPEVAFLGRSNVGKSSLINALTGRRGLARISNTPGRTRQLNFFDLAGRLALVDLPGYGYAAASKSEIAAWSTLIRRYLRGRARLRRVCLLIDSRRGLMETDAPAMRLCDETGLSYQIVLTKIDAPRADELAAICAAVAAALAARPAAHPELVLTSAATGDGIPALRAALVELAEVAPARVPR